MRASEKEEARARTMMNHGGDGPAATNLRRDPFKTSVGKGAGQRRRQAAITIGKDRRDSVVRAKRLRRADPADHGDGDAMQLAAVAADDDVAYKLLEDSTAAAVLNLKNIGKKSNSKESGGFADSEAATVVLGISTCSCCCASWCSASPC